MVEGSAAPPVPRDWRWIVAGLGKLLIAIGVLILLFVGYQLWGTGIQYRQSQAQLEKDFNRLAAATATTTTVPPRANTTSPGATPTTSAVTLPPPPPVATSVPQEGDPVGVIRISKIGLESWIVAGVDPPDLRKGVGHYPSTPMPGEQGNASLAGHRTTYGAPFYDLDRLDPGDLISVQTLAGSFTYSVTGSTVVSPSDTHVIDDQPDKVMLTLTTCDPKYSARNRLIVTADLVPAKSDRSPPPGRRRRRPSAPGQTATSAPATTPATLPGSETGETDAGGHDRRRHGRHRRRDGRRRRLRRWLVQRRRRLAAGRPVGPGLHHDPLGAWFVSRRSRNFIGACSGSPPSSSCSTSSSRTSTACCPRTSDMPRSRRTIPSIAVSRTDNLPCRFAKRDCPPLPPTTTGHLGPAHWLTLDRPVTMER